MSTPNKINYNNEMKKLIEANSKLSVKPTLLLHACCAPCASICMDRVRDYFDTTVFFYNPNITSALEFDKRKAELARLIDIYNEDKDRGALNLIVSNYNPDEFMSIARGYEDCPERGKRCMLCYELRLRHTYDYATAHNFDYFATTLTLSPLKDAEALNRIGLNMAQSPATDLNPPTKHTAYLPTDFKKDNGYIESIRLSKEYDLYRQNYCGCVYSK